MENFFQKCVLGYVILRKRSMLTFVLDHIRRDIEVLQGAIAAAQIRTEGRTE